MIIEYRGNNTPYHAVLATLCPFLMSWKRRTVFNPPSVDIHATTSYFYNVSVFFGIF